MGRGSTQSRFRPDIEGLRAVAVVAVVLFHADVPGVGGGFVGVDVFFVISGFLITGLLWREVSASGTVRMRNFYGARARRLLPASAAVGVVTVIASAVLLPPLQAQNVIRDGIASAAYVSNYWFIQEGLDYFGTHLPPSPFQHYWSLGVEEQFYLVWAPMIIATAWLARRVRRRAKDDAPSSPASYLVVLGLVAVVSFALSLAITHVMPLVAFFSLPTRAWQLALGGIVALTAGQWRRLPPRAAAITGWAGLGAILLACARLNAATLYPGVAAALPVLGAGLVIGAGCAAPAQGCGRVLGLAPMRAIGRISYSWYLWHWPVLVLTPALLGHPLGLAGRLAAAAVSAVLAALTLRYIENPLRYAPRIRRSALASLALGGAATMIAIVVGVATLVLAPAPVGRGAPAAPLTVTATPVPIGSTIDAYDAAVQQAFAQVQSAVAASAEIRAVPSNLSPPLANVQAEQRAMFLKGCMRNFYEVGQPQCATGGSAPTTVALVGDSHAAMWTPAFQQLLPQRPWRLEIMAKAGCPLMDLPVVSPVLHRDYTECAQWRGQILARLRTEHPQLIVLGLHRGYGSESGNTSRSPFTSYDPAWLHGLTQLVRELRGTGAKVLVLGPVPDPQVVVPVCLSGHLDDANACSPARSTAVNQAGIVAEAEATKSGGGEYADLTDLFCAAKSCPVIVGNTLVYLDWNHLTVEYCRVLAPVIGAVTDRALARR
nr:acyltransferase family protein [Mycobacterium sp. E796]